MSDACCAPPRNEASPSDDRSPPLPSVRLQQPAATLVTVPAGQYLMGDESEWCYPGDGEHPVHSVEMPNFQVDSVALSNQRFADFAEATGWQTDAERFGWSFVFGGLLPDDFELTRGVDGAPWWRQVMGATWRHPEGPHSDLSDRLDHPAVHISWTDAQAYCSWSGTRLPTEAEWEVAARGGLESQPFPWGDTLEPEGKHCMNVFQGEFPDGNTGADGYLGTAPVDSYEPNGYGIYNATGNVWEWCSDWYDVDYYRSSPLSSPEGPSSGMARVQRGGSYLCHDSYCRRYRVSARFASSPDASTSNVGFRVAADCPS